MGLANFHTDIADIKYNIRKVFIILLAAAFLGVGFSAAVSAATGDGETDGDIRYTAYGVRRQASFEAEETSRTCNTSWVLNGAYTVDFEYQGGHYVHDAVISNQAQSAYNISGGYPAGGPYTYAWSGAGNVQGNTVTNSVDYTVGAVGTHMNMIGTIAPAGTMSGSWSDNFGGMRQGTWSTTSGAATQSVSGCRAIGKFRYSDVNGNWYRVDVQYMKVVGETAWFAGPVTSGNVGAGQWLFAKVIDGDEDDGLIWGSFTNAATAKLSVAHMSNPADGPFGVTSGDIDVDD